MNIQALPFGQRASISGRERNLELVSDGKVDYFDETYYDQPDDQVSLRLEQGVREFCDPRLSQSLARLASEYKSTGKIRKSTANQCARALGKQWKAEIHRNSGWSEYTVAFSLGDPQRVSPQEISYRTFGNKVDVRTFLPCEKLGAGSHSMSGECDDQGNIKNGLEYLTCS